MKAFSILLSLVVLSASAVEAQVSRPKVTIRVLDKKTLQPVQATIVVMSQRADKQLVPVYEDSMYKFKIAAGDTSILTIYAEGYQTLNEAIWASRLNGTETFYITPNPNRALETNQKPLLKEDITTVLYFSQSETKVLEKSKLHLETIAEFLQNNGERGIELTGHTDNVGDAYKNFLLSNARADTIKTYLLGSRIAAERIQSRAFGDKKPVAPNDTEENRSLNRRVEMRVK